MQTQIDALLLRIDNLSDTVELAGIQEEMHRICAQLPDEQRLPFIQQYAERVKTMSQPNE